jgi:putative aminopeptidase FrvX
MSLPPVDTDSLLANLTGLLNTPSPTGFTARALEFTTALLKKSPQLAVEPTRKGGLLATWPGQHSDRPRALTAHFDTLGAMVKEIKENGRLLLTQIGGYAWNTVEGEGCTVISANGKQARGALLFEKASAHVFREKVSEGKRSSESMEVRLDLRTSSDDETRALGIAVGDFVAFDPRLEVADGFVRSRHLDDKAGVACLLAAIKGLQDAGLAPVQKTYFYFSNFEEVGHGAAAGIPADTVELLVVDMAAVGKGQASDEFHSTLCVKDSNGPYHYSLSQRLRALAEREGIAYKVDIYPYYGSDGGAYWSAGADAAVALIGPGVDASHNYERTHLEALTATTQWIMAYLLED